MSIRHGSTSPPTHARIAADRYFSPDYMKLEWDRMWTSVWLLAVDLADIPRPGDHAVVEIGRESIVVVRGEDASVRAFFNVCQHRGNVLCHSPTGHAMRLKCRYHQWQWDLEGNLASVPDRREFPSAPARELALRSVACEVFGGFAWVSMADDPMPLSVYLGLLRDELERYPLEAYTRVHQTTVELPCNWKTWVDGVNEVYHVHSMHPQLLPMVDDVNVEITLYERHSRHIVPFGVPSPRLAPSDVVPDALCGAMRDVGLDPGSFSGRVAEVRPAIQRAIRARARDDLSGGKLDDRQLTDGVNYHAFPNATFELHYGRYTLLRARPHPTEPERMYFDEWDYVRAPRGSVRCESPIRFRYGEHPLSPVLAQDVEQLVHVQRGMHSRGFQGLYLGAHERRIAHMHRTLESYLGEATD